MLVEIHMLKNYVPTNLNRDDTGAPKTCVFGGVQRGRISSQCLKRSWRTSEIFQEEIGVNNIGIRTRKLPQLVKEQLIKDDIAEERADIVAKILSGIGTKEGKMNKKNPYGTQQIIIYSPADIRAVVEDIKNRLNECKSNEDIEKIDVKDIQNLLQKSNKRAITLDIALFGRMVTSNAFADVEASVQVAHAISTHKVLMEADYYSAVDDLIDGSTSDESGSGMLGDIDYNSSCYYIYASLDTDKLKDNLKHCENRDELVRKTVPALIKTMAFSNPSGKQNSFAGNALPCAILVECKDNHVSVNYANAFEKPIKANREGGYIFSSIEGLKEEAQHIQDVYGIPTLSRLWFSTEEVLMDDEYATNCNTFTELLSKLPNI